MGNLSKFLSGDGLTGDKTPTASTTKASDSAPTISAENRGTAELIVKGSYAGDESATYEVLVTSVSPGTDESEITNVDFQGASTRAPNALEVNRVSDVAPVGLYELTCLDPGQEDKDAHTDFIFEDEGVRFKANSNFTDPIDVSGSAGNNLRMAIYALAPSYGSLNLASAASYPRPTGNIFLEPLNPVGFSNLQKDRFVTESSKFSLFPSTWTYPYYPDNQESPLIPFINSEDNYPFTNVSGVDGVTGLFLPQLFTSRFLLGYPMPPGSNNPSTAELLEKVFLGRVFSEYIVDPGDGSGDFLYKVKGYARSTGSSNALPDLPAGCRPYPVTGGYLVHVYLLNSADPTGTHLADFFYWKFPIKNEAGSIEWYPITTWGELAFALDQHNQKGLYYAQSETPVFSGILRYPPVILDTDTAVAPRRRRFSAWENADILFRSGGICDIPSFQAARLNKLENFKIKNRSKLKDEEVIVESTEIVDGYAVFDVKAPASSELGSAPTGLGDQVIAKLRSRQLLSDVLAASAPAFLSEFGLDFSIPAIQDLSGSGTTQAGESTEPITSHEISLVQDTPENPRTLNLCVDRLYMGPGITKAVVVTAIFTKRADSGCPECENYSPDDFEDCIGVGITGAANTGDKELTDIAYTIGGEKIYPIPFFGRLPQPKAPFLIEKENWVLTDGVGALLTRIDEAISEYEGLAFQIEVIDRSGIDSAFRVDKNSPDYTILLEGSEITGGLKFPNEVLDPFCPELTSGCTPITVNCDNGKSYSSWGQRVDYGLNRPAHFSGALSAEAVKIAKSFFDGLGDPSTGPFRRFFQVLDDFSQAYSPFDTHSAFIGRWGASAPAILSDSSAGVSYNQEWATSGVDYYIPLYNGKNRGFDKFLYFFRFAFLDRLPNLSGISPYTLSDVIAEADQLIEDWAAYVHDPGGYLELKYSSHANWNEIFKWLYRLPQTHGDTGDARLDARHTELSSQLNGYAFAQGAVNADYWRVKVSYTYSRTGYSYDWETTGPPGQSNIYPYTQPALTETRTDVLTFPGHYSEAEVLAIINENYSGTITHTLDTKTVQGTYNLVPTPSSWTETYAIQTKQVKRAQNLNAGLTDTLQSRIGALLAGLVGADTAIPASQWEAIHMGGLQITKKPSENPSNIHVIGDPNYFGPKSFYSDRAMDQVFWLRLIKLLVKCGYYYDIENSLFSCTIEGDYTNLIGRGDSQGCRFVELDEDYWRVTVEDAAVGSAEAYPKAYTNHTYQDLLKLRFVFRIKTLCPQELKYGDTVVMKFIPAGESESGQVQTYAVGEKVSIRTRNNRRLALSDGSSGLDTATWRFKGPSSSSVPLLDIRILNRAGTDVEIPSSDLFDLFSGRLEVLTRYAEGDKFIWALSGGKFLVRKSDGSVFGPADLSQITQEVFSGDGVQLGFRFNSSLPFQLGDRWLVNLIQTNAASRAVNWNMLQSWQSQGNTDETLEYDLGTPTSVNVAVIVSNLTTSGTLYLEAKNSGDSWASPPFSQELSIFDPYLDGFENPPAIYVSLAGTTAYQQWRIRMTDATLNTIKVKLFYLGSDSNGVTSLVYDHDPSIQFQVVTNPYDVTNSGIFKGIGANFAVEYSWLPYSSFKSLSNVFIGCKQANNRPFLWLPNYLRPELAFVCRFSDRSLGGDSIAGFLNANPLVNSEYDVYESVKIPMELVR